MKAKRLVVPSWVRKTSKAALWRRMFELSEMVKRLDSELYGITPAFIAHTLNRDTKAGETIQVRRPARFVSRLY